MSEKEKNKEEKRTSKGLKSLFERKKEPSSSASAKKKSASQAEVSYSKESKEAKSPKISKFSKISLREKTPENPAVTFKGLSEGSLIVEKYAIEDPYSNIQIVQPPELGGGKAYYIEEVKLKENEKFVLDKLFDIISKEIEPSKDVKNQLEQVANEAHRLTLKYGLYKKITPSSWNKILYYLHRNLVGYGDIDVIMKDSMIEDLSINGVGTPLYVWHRKYESIPTNLTFTNESALNNLIIKLTHMAGKHISTAFPLLDAMLPGKDRLAATFKREVSPKGSSISIRRFREEPFSIIDLIELGTINEEIGAYFWLLIENRATMAIIGGTGAGKTSTLNAIASLVKPSMKIVTVEEIPELNIPHENWVQLVSRESYGLGEMKTGSVSLFELVKTSLRYRPDYIVVGEIRGEEAFVLFQALATGHGGLTTFHADSLDYTVKRLTSPPMNVADAYVPLINAAVLVERVQLPISSSAIITFGRRVKSVQEVVEFEKYNTISTWNPITDTFSVHFKDSKQLGIIAAKHGVPFEEVLSEIQARAGLLRQLRASGVRKNVDLAKSITAYYLQEKYLNVRALSTDDDKLALKTEEQKR
jgi:flagellar protein FlaI